MNQPVYLSLLIYEFWCDYVKPKYDENAKRYMDTGSFIVHVKTEYIYRC